MTPHAAQAPEVKPAFVLAAEHAARVEEELEAEAEIKAAREKAGYALGAEAQDGDKNAGATVTGQPITDPTKTPLDPLTGLAPASIADAALDLRGKGWIRCADGTRVRDDGRSIHIPGRKFTPAQMAVVAELAAQKGWSTVYVYKTNGAALHPEATQKLSAAIAQMGLGLQCCTSQKTAGKINSHYQESEECLRQTLLRARNAAKGPSPV